MTASLPAVDTSPNDLGSRGSARRRVLALASAEIRLLLRNRTAAVNSLLGPALLLGSVGAIDVSHGIELDGPGLVASAIGITLILVAYYNLGTTFVARREELVLQRMRTGELTDGGTLLGTSRRWPAADRTAGTAGGEAATSARGHARESRWATDCGMVEQLSGADRPAACIAAVSWMPMVATAACHPPMPASSLGTCTLAAPLMRFTACGSASGPMSRPPPV